MTLAATTFASGILGYVCILVLTRSLGPERYGELGSLLGVALIFSVTQTALQLDLTRVVATGSARPTRWLLRRSALASLVTAGLCLAMTPAIMHALRLTSWAPALALAAMLIPTTFIGGVQGILLGRGQTVLFGTLLVIGGLSRTLAAIATGLAGGGATYALWATTATAVLAALVGLALLPRLSVAERRGRRTRRVPVGTPRGVVPGDEGALDAGPVEAVATTGQRTGWVGMGRAAVGAGALMVLLNADLLAARSVLADRESGWYAFLTIFGRVTFWGTNFIALWVFPHVAARRSATRAVRYALGAVALVGLVCVLGAWFFGRALTESLAGPDYVPAAHYAPVFAAIGVLLSVVQLATYVDVARERHTVSVIVWAAGLALILGIRLASPHTIGGVMTTTLIVLGAVAVAGLFTLRTRPEGTVSRAREALGVPR